MATNAETVRSDFSPEVRSKQIGGTDSGVIAKKNPWLDPRTLYYIKKGLIEQPEENAAMRGGKLLEPVLADIYAEAMCCKLVTPEILTHPEHSFIVGHPDRHVMSPEDGGVPQRGLEIKTTNPFNLFDWGEEWSDQIPAMYIIQVQHYQGLDGLSSYDVIVSPFSPEIVMMFFEAGMTELTDPVSQAMKIIAKPKFYRVHRDDDLIKAVFELDVDFHDRMKHNNPPDVGWTKKAEEYLRSKYKKDCGTELSVSADEAIYETLTALAKNRALKKEIKRQEQGFKNAIMDYMGDASRLVCPIGSVSWKASKDAEQVNWNKLAADLKISPETIAKYTEAKPGPRTFRPNLKLEGVE